MKKNKARTLLVLGAQWGDEGKGKIVDFLSSYFDYSVRFQGGPNAGHTVVFDRKKIVLHTIPSGILRENCCAVISNGVLVDPDILEKELEDLRRHGFDFRGRLFISHLCHIILPFHKIIDELIDRRNKIGTTKMGVGPAVEFKVLRYGIRIKDLTGSMLKEKIDSVVEMASYIIRSLDDNKYSEQINSSGYKSEIYDKLMRFAEMVHPFICDTRKLLKTAILEGKKVILEGAQGILLDLDFGTYPYVTSTNTSPGGAIAGTGLSPCDIDVILGVSKAYATRVGGGPFPSELNEEEARILRDLGGEYGSTTGRPRRVGWLDIPLLRFAKDIGGFDFMALTKIDTLKKLGKAKYVKSYITPDGTDIYDIDTSLELGKVNPVFEEVSPDQIKTILERELNVKIVISSYGPERDSIHTDEEFLALFY